MFTLLLEQFLTGKISLVAPPNENSRSDFRMRAISVIQWVSKCSWVDAWKQWVSERLFETDKGQQRPTLNVCKNIFGMGRAYGWTYHNDASCQKLFIYSKPLKVQFLSFRTQNWHISKFLNIFWILYHCACLTYCLVSESPSSCRKLSVGE